MFRRRDTNAIPRNGSVCNNIPSPQRRASMGRILNTKPTKRKYNEQGKDSLNFFLYFGLGKLFTNLYLEGQLNDSRSTRIDEDEGIFFLLLFQFIFA
jgi:hypothetical protein